MPYYVGDINPDYSSAMGLLQHLSVDELRDLLNDDTRLEGMVKDLPQVKNLEAEREMLLASNKSLAEFNLSREPTLQQTRQQLIELYKKATDLKKEVEKRKQQLDETAHQTSLDTTLALLQTAAAQAEEETESLADTFLEGGSMSAEEFLEKFLEQRKVAHLRRVKSEKMMELLTTNRDMLSSPRPHHRSSLQHNMGPSTSSSSFLGPTRPAPPPPPPPTHPMYIGYNLPYPMPGTGIPMPPYGK